MKKIGLLLFLLTVFYFIFLIRQDIIDNLELKRGEVQALNSIQHEKSRARELHTRLVELKSDNYIEQLARTRLGLVKDGETAYKIISNDK